MPEDEEDYLLTLDGEEEKALGGLYKEGGHLAATDKFDETVIFPHKAMLGAQPKPNP